MIRQWIPGCWSGDRKCTGPKSAAANSRNWQSITSGRSQMLTTSGPGTSETGTQWSARYHGTRWWRQRWTVTTGLYCTHRRRRHREASEGRSVAPRWPRRTAILQRSAGEGLSLSMRIWSIHLQRGRQGGRFHTRLGSQPSVSALCAGTSSSSLAIWPKTALRRRDMVLEIDESNNQSNNQLVQPNTQKPRKNIQ